ncbi:calcium-binding protein [Paracoccus sp. (in: a-proteobacteria)]|uniref:calcium-binding protein n=1 Tax=Paracoccus sp. TaxID=267 RepID=UPI003A85C681
MFVLAGMLGVLLAGLIIDFGVSDDPETTEDDDLALGNGYSAVPDDDEPQLPPIMPDHETGTISAISCEAFTGGVADTPLDWPDPHPEGALTGDADANLLILPGGSDLRGGGGADIVRGGAGDDSLAGQNGNDTIRGRAGDDTIFGGAGNDRLTGGAGVDWISGNEGDDTLVSGGGADDLDGGGGDDVLIGSDDPDRVWMHGDEGNDRLVPGAGDFAEGLAGADTFVLRGAHDDLPVIADFDHREDQIELHMPDNVADNARIALRPQADGGVVIQVNGASVGRLLQGDGLTVEDIVIVRQM